MQKTKIEWCDYTANPVKGLCPVGCSYCYARAMYHRFNMDEALTFHPEVFDAIEKLKEPSRIFVGSTMELFGDWITDHILHSIFNYVEHYPQHTFIFLTKRPENLIKWSPFPENAWVGVSAVHQLAFWSGMHWMAQVKAKVKFVSFEPLQESVSGANPDIAEHLQNGGISWVICGQQTPVKQSTMPKIEWVKEIIEAADEAGIPVFLKDNLKKLFSKSITYQDKWAFAKDVGRGGLYRQEFPKG